MSGRSHRPKIEKSTQTEAASRKEEESNLEEVEVAGDLSAGVLQRHEFVEGHHDEPGGVVLLRLLLWGHQVWFCKRNGAATGSGKEGAEAGRARRAGEVGMASRGGERPEEEREEAVAAGVDGGRHGFHAILRATISQYPTP